MRNRKRCMNYVGQSLEHPQIKIEDIDDVIAGDHLIFKRGVGIPGGGRLDFYDHHAILRDVDYVDHTLKVTAFDGPFPEDGRKAKVVTKEIDYADLEGSLYKVKYGPGEALNRGEVLRRADRIEREYRRMGNNISPDSQYHLLSNNCEHFAYYCKVGDRKSVQVKNLKRTVVGVSANVIKDLVKLYLLDGKGKLIPSKVKYGGPAASGIIEAVFTSDDIYRYYQMMQRGTIDEDEFIELVLKRLLIAVTSVAGAELGSIAGFSVAGPVGLFLGGILGNISGRLVGRAMGEAVVFGKDVVLALLERYGSRLHDD